MNTRWVVPLALLLAAACSRRGDVPAARVQAEPSYELRVGKSTYDSYCQTCHGETGAGDGSNAFNLDPRPRDLTVVESRAQKTDADLEDAIRRGGAGVGLSPLMPPYGRTLTADQVRGVVLFLRTLRKPS